MVSRDLTGSDAGDVELAKLLRSSTDDNKKSSRILSEDSDTDIFSVSRRAACAGYLAQYFSIGIIMGGLPATFYGVFLGYLNVPAYVYATASVVSMLPWSFKFLFGMLNDTVPVQGLQRKPYMILGWCLCAAMLGVLWSQPLPPPYWCIDDNGKYITHHTFDDGTKEPAKPCNPEAAKSGGKFALLMMLASLGYIIADVAADGLTVEYARNESRERRGTTQTIAYMVRTFGASSATAFVGFCMNSTLYNGSFSWGLSFNSVCAVFALPAIAMVPISALLVEEPKGKAGGQLLNIHF